MFDAYSVRKLLPRVLVAAIVISLSWQIMQFLVTFTNDLGLGVRYLIYQPFVHAGLNSITIDSGDSWTAWLGGAVALTTFGLFGLLSFAGTAILAVFIAVMVLILRQIVIIFLVITAPIAMVAYILPNTQNIFKLWWESLSKALMMFPLITGMIAIGRVFSAVTVNGPGSEPTHIIGFVAYFAPYFLIPATFKLAGGAIRQIGGFVNDRGKGGLDRLRNYRGNVAKKNFEDLKEGRRLKGEGIGPFKRPYRAFSRSFNNATRGTANLKNAGYNPMQVRNRMSAAASTHATDGAREALEKNHEMVAIKSDDDLVEAGLYAAMNHGGDEMVREELTRRGYNNVEQGVALVRAARRSMDEHTFETSMAIASFGTSSGWTPKYRQVLNEETGELEDWRDPETNERQLLTSFGNGGGGEARAMINTITGGEGGDRQRAIQILGAARQQAESKGRYDLVGGSFTDDVAQLEILNKAGNDRKAIQTNSEVLLRGALDGTGRGRLFGGHKRAIDALAPQVRTNLNEAFFGSSRRAANPDAAIQQLAFAANSLDAASSNSPESAAVFNEQVLNKTVDYGSLNDELKKALAPAFEKKIYKINKAGQRELGPDNKPIVEKTEIAKTLSYGQIMENMRLDPQFGRYRREYGRGEDAAASELGAEAGKPTSGDPTVGA